MKRTELDQILAKSEARHKVGAHCTIDHATVVKMVESLKRQLVVIRECGECSAWDHTCHADDQERVTGVHDAPPEWCPRQEK